MNKTCNNCLFGDTCAENTLCNHYAAMNGNDFDEDTYIEEERENFFGEWNRYIDAVASF